MLKLRSQVLSYRVFSDLKKRSTIGIVFYIIALCITVFSGGYYQRHPSFSNQFLALISTICIFRLVHMGIDQHLPQNRINKIVFIISVILTALTWGVGYAKFTLQPNELYTQHLIVTCTIGLCAGGVVAFIPCLWLALGFNACTMVPGIISLLVFTENYPLGILFLLFFLFMIFMAIRQNNEYWTALDNESLLEQQTKALKKLSDRDSLTGLYNRRYFNQTFSYEWKRAVRKDTDITVLMCDVDHFKKINDQYGHMVGDEYLKMVAKILQRVFKRETDIVARYGGEEFIILMVEETIETAQILAENFRHLVAKSLLEFENQSISTTISLGLANIIPTPNMAKEKLISIADKSLYIAKEQGRNQLHINLSGSLENSFSKTGSGKIQTSN